MKQYPLRRECCVCHCEIKPHGWADRPGIVTHGYCAKCLKKTEADWKAAERKRK